MIKRLSGQRPKYELIQIPSYAWGKCQILQKQIGDGMVKWKNFNKQFPTEKYWELMENRLSSSGIFSQYSRHWKSVRKTEDRIIFMSMFTDMDWTRRGKSEHCVSNYEQVKNDAKNFSQGHTAFLAPGIEKKWYGNTSYILEGTWHATVNLMVDRFEESGHPSFKSVSPLARGILRRKNNKETNILLKEVRPAATHFWECICPQSDFIPRNWGVNNEKGQFRSFMSDLYLWMQAWSDQGEKMLAIVWGTDKLDNNAIAFDCSDDEFRSIEASLYQVLHRTTANEPVSTVQQARGQT